MQSFMPNQVITEFKLGNITESFNMIKKGCRTKPEVMAYRLAKTVGSMCDPDGFHNDPDMAVNFLKLWAMDN